MKIFICLIVLAGLTAPAVADQDLEALLQEAGCVACHQVAQPMVGPSYESVAERYRDQDGAADDVFTRMREGSQGVWGEAPMPPVTEDMLSDEQMRTVIDWILSR